MNEFLTSLWQKIKNIVAALVAVAAAVFAFLFFYQRNKNSVDDALLKEQKLNADLAKDQQAIDVNNSQLKIEEQKRADLEKKDENNKNASDSDVTQFLNDRK